MEGDGSAAVLKAHGRLRAGTTHRGERVVQEALPGVRRSSKWTPTLLAWLLIAIAGLILPRAVLIAKAWPILIDSDEAIVGLMARHMLGGDVPVWFYGQAYMGSLEPATGALLFALFGATPLVLKFVPLIWFCAFLVAHHRLARDVAGTRVAPLATVLAAASPAFLTVWSMKSQGGYMALLCLGTVALLLTTRMLALGVTTRRAASLGLVLGLAWWTHFLAIAYIVPIVLLAITTRRDLWWSRPAAAFLAGSLVGSLPFWVYNLLRGWASFHMSAPYPASFATGLYGFFWTAVPIVAGTRPEGGPADFFPFGSALGVLLFLAAIVIPLVRWPHVKAEGHARYGVPLLLGMFACFPLIFAASGFGGVVEVPRYVLPLYSGLYVLLLVGLTRSGQILVTSFLLLIHVTGSLRTSPVDVATTLNAEPDDALIEFLDAKHVARAYAPYWVAYRLTFETGERIICTPPNDGGVRYPPHLGLVAADPAPAYVRLSAPQYDGAQAPLRIPADYVGTRVGNYEVFLPPEPTTPRAHVNRGSEELAESE